MTREEKLRAQMASLARAVERLKAALERPKDEFIRDSAIQRFEFTFELAWKTLKTFLELQGLEARSPRELRNLTNHTYDEALAERIYAELPKALERFQELLRRLEEPA